MDDQLENIIKYLDNEMSKNERLDFENQIRKDKALAAEVEFQRGLHGFLKRDKPELEQKLSNLGDEFIINQQNKKRAFPYWIVLLILFIALLMGYFLFFSKKDNPIPNDSQTPPQIEEIIPTDEIKKEAQETIKKPVEPIDKIEKPVKTPPSKPEKTPDKEQPIALLDEKIYAQNAMMEDVITANYRTDEKDDSVIITIPEEDAVFKYSEAILLTVQGSSSTLDDYQLIIYSNRDFDIENDIRILDAKIDSQLNNERYQFNFNGNIALEKGLYYLIIRKNGTRDILHISRFTVE